ncbi:mucin-22-like [Maniola jurtina]|uniref:mucin-22-like n=1 Tax=Maniola jurtina TaxID=191418 RepID=UPI001E689968|nr:mucin-22-like [Maniola jurtina]XP_045772327.1 mucin-22-like [Maniola jurtina]
MKMKIPVRRSCISLIVLSALVETIRTNENETSTAEGRKGRVSGRIVKLYSGYKPDPVLCHEEGFKADPVQCSAFYRCVKSSSGKFTVFKFQCGPGTVYDPDTEVCNHPSNTKRSECRGIKSHDEEDNENENDIDQHELPSPISTIVPVYTSAANNIIGYTTYKVPRLNNSGVYIPSTENGYIYPITTSPPPYDMESTPQKVQDNNHNLIIYPWTKNSTQPKITTSTTLPILEKNQPCTSDGFMGDGENCKKFYRCVSNLRGGFIRYEFLCSEPTVWDDHMQSCNYPWAVRSRRCGRGGIHDESYTQISHLTNNVASEQTSVSYGNKIPEAQNQESIRKEPPASYGNGLKNEDEYNKDKNHTSYESPMGNNPTMPSDDKDIETETNVQMHDINNYINFGQKITAQSTYSTDKLAENSVTQHSGIRQNFICTQSGFIGDYIDCKKFYRCVENGKGSFTKYEFTCSQGTVWDKKLEACNYAWAVKECGGASAGDSLVTADSLISKTSTTATVLSENVDNGYINHSNQEYESPSTITVSTPVSLISTTAASNQIGKECTVPGFLGDKNDCKKFYRCVDNGRGTFTKYEYECGDGTLWDQNIKACNHAWAVHSCNSPSSNSTMHTSENTAKTQTTPFLIQSTTPEKLQDNNDYSDVYGPQLDTASPNSEIKHETTLAPMMNQKNECESTGFRGDTNDCKKFYRCVSNGQRGFIKYEFSCGEGTVWDPEIEACNHAWAVKHCGSSIPLNHEVTSSPIDNTHSSTNIHDLGVTTTISSIQTTTSQKEIGDYDSGYGQQPNESTKIPIVNLETTTIKQTLGQTNICQMAGFIGDINNCNKFYRCVDNGNGGFIQYEFSCGEGTVWDPEIEACNHAWAVKRCGGSTTSAKPPLTSSTTNLNIVESSNGYVTNNYIDRHNDSYNFVETTTLSSSTATLTTAANTRNECKSSGFIGDNSDCQKFYRCVDNGDGGFVKHEFMCGEGTVWDTKIEACNHKWAVEKCGGDSHNEFVETTTHSLPLTSPVTESTVSVSVTYSSSTTSTTTAMTPLPTHEDKGCRSEGYFANPNDCKKFYRCVYEDKDGYTKYEFSCAEGTAWDVKIQSCNYMSKVEACHSNQHPMNTTETKPVHDEQVMESETSKSTTSTSTTAVSTTSSPTTLSSTTSSSTTFASTTSASTTSASTTKNTKPAGQNTCNDEGYFGDTNDCKKFYRCVYENDGKYTKYDFTCGDGTIWDQDIITCNHPSDVKTPSCKSETESTSPISTSTSTSSTTKRPQQTTTDSNETPPSTTTVKPSTSDVATNKNDTNSNCSNSTTENPNSKNFTCSKAGFYADQSNCKKFYRCVDWENNGKKFSVYHFECADGTIWDPALETCNHEDSVYPPRNCNTTQQQNESTAVTSTTTEQITTTTNQTESTTTSSKPTKTTTKSTTTSEYSSTQTTQTSPTEKPTTQLSTTQSTTTQSSTTDESTTQTSTMQSSTTDESTTQTSTTQSSTTDESTTQTSTTQSSTTDESTTQTSTTQSSTTDESTTQTSTTQSSTTDESTTQTSTTQSSTTDESTTQASTTQSSTTDESTTQTSNTQSSTTDESTTQSSTTQSSTTEESTTQSSTTKESTTEESTTSTTENNPESSTTETSTKKECPDTADDQSLYVCPTSFKRHPKYCNLFYQCTEDNANHELKIAVFHCPNNTIYDESKVKCVAENNSSKKCNGQISQKHTVKQLGASQNDPFVVTKKSMACPSSGHFPFEKDTECSSSLLKCELTKSGTLQGFVYRCPDGYVYWNISRRCEPIRKVRDCKRSSYPWKRRYDIPLETSNISP